MADSQRLECPNCGARFRLNGPVGSRSRHCLHCRAPLTVIHDHPEFVPPSSLLPTTPPAQSVHHRPAALSPAPTPVPPATDGKAAGEIGDLFVRLAAQAAKADHPSPDPRLDEVLARLETLAHHIARPRPRDERLDQILKRLETLERDLADLAGRDPLPEPVAQRLEALDQALRQPDPRLDQLARRDALEKLDAEIAQLRQLVATPPAPDPRVDELRQQLARLLEQPAPLAPRLDAMNARLDHLADTFSAASTAEQLRTVLARLADLDHRLSAPPVADPRFDAVETKLDQTLAALARAAATDRLEPLRQSVETLVRRFDEAPSAPTLLDDCVRQTRAASEAVETRIAQLDRDLAGLEQKLENRHAEIADRLQTLPENLAGLRTSVAGLAQSAPSWTELSAALVAFRAEWNAYTAAAASANAESAPPWSELAESIAALRAEWHVYTESAASASDDAIAHADSAPPWLELAESIAALRAEWHVYTESAASASDDAIAHADSAPPWSELAESIATLRAEWKAQVDSPEVDDGDDSGADFLRREFARFEENTHDRVATLLNDRLDLLLAALESRRADGPLPAIVSGSGGVTRLDTLADRLETALARPPFPDDRWTRLEALLAKLSEETAARAPDAETFAALKASVEALRADGKAARATAAAEAETLAGVVQSAARDRHAQARAAGREALVAWVETEGTGRKLVPWWAFASITMTLVLILGWQVCFPPPSAPETLARIETRMTSIETHLSQSGPAPASDPEFARQVEAIQLSLAHLSERALPHAHAAARLGQGLLDLRAYFHLYSARQAELLKNYQDTLDDALRRQQKMQETIRDLELRLVRSRAEPFGPSFPDTVSTSGLTWEVGEPFSAPPVVLNPPALPPALSPPPPFPSAPLLP